MTSSQKGIVFALLSYFSWGVGPIYFKMLSSVPAKEILCHRIVWSFILLASIVLIANRWHVLKAIFKTPKKLAMLVASGLLIATNWFTFIWAVTNNHLLEASLGYYINPLLTIFLGAILFKDNLSPLKSIALALVFIGVAIQVIVAGTIPWISLILAVTFSLYGLIRKVANVDSLVGLMIETFILVPVAAFYLFFTESQTGSLMENELYFNLLLMCAGVVTTFPLVFFSAAAVRLNLSSLGFLQYIAPTIMWLLAVFAFHEPVDHSIVITFAFIWMGLLCFSFDGVFRRSFSRLSLAK